MSGEPIRVLHLFGQMVRGGAELRTLDIVRGCDSAEFESHFCVLSGLRGSLDDEIIALGGRVHYCRLGPLFPFRFLRLLHRERIGVVHSHVHLASGLMVALARLANVPVRVVHFRASADGSHPTRLRKTRDALLRVLIRRYATAIVAVSKSTMDQAWSPDWLDDPRCVVVYNGIRPPHHLGSDRYLARAVGIPDASPVIIHVGSMRPEKDHPRLLRVFGEVLQSQPMAHLILVGRGTDAQLRPLRRQIADDGLDGRVHLVGEQAEVSPWLNLSSLMIFPSASEGLPGAALEALIHGVPVLASPIPVFFEIAPYFPHLYVAEPQETDAEWAIHACRLMHSAAPDSSARIDLARHALCGPFSLRVAIAEHRGVWASARKGE